MHPHHVEAERLAQFLVNFAEHLVAFGHLHAMAVRAEQGVPQAVDRARPNASLEAGAKINAEAVGFGMIQGCLQSFA